MTTTAIIDAAGVVQDMILALHSEVDPQALGRPEGWRAIDGEGGAIGDTWDGTAFVRPLVPEPEPVVPESVTRAQGKAALVQAGLWAGVLAYVASIADPTQQALAEIALHDTQEWRRDSPFLAACAVGLGLTPEQLDALFIAAGEIVL
ncbi:hypothetical protein [Xenophilus sp. Marseille-Q4582]|uniref:hypothetical protein n=1 Tax=Xenophilus sp. Marseille-Q4582 TaxID=2866600 RepID=UPI001CE44350|nr:hypothetical protein [Xenophilus sp. Marseille-Q4582]